MINRQELIYVLEICKSSVEYWLNTGVDGAQIETLITRIQAGEEIESEARIQD